MESREGLRKELGISERTLRSYEKDIRRGALLEEAPLKLGIILKDPVFDAHWMVVWVWGPGEDESGPLRPAVSLAPGVVPDANLRGAVEKDPISFRRAKCLWHPATATKPCMLFLPGMSPTVLSCMARRWETSWRVQGRFATRAGDYLEAALQAGNVPRPPASVDWEEVNQRSRDLEFLSWEWEEDFGDELPTPEEEKEFLRMTKMVVETI